MNLACGTTSRGGLRHLLQGWWCWGSNGEAVQLDDRKADRALAVAGEVLPKDTWLMAGAGRESTSATVAASVKAAELGADAVIVCTPAFFQASNHDRSVHPPLHRTEPS